MQERKKFGKGYRTTVSAASGAASVNEFGGDLIVPMSLTGGWNTAWDGGDFEVALFVVLGGDFDDSVVVGCIEATGVGVETGAEIDTEVATGAARGVTSEGVSDGPFDAL